nr:MAG: RNA-dependent RNA polymerase [Crogonang virus 164]
MDPLIAKQNGEEGRQVCSKCGARQSQPNSDKVDPPTKTKASTKCACEKRHRKTCRKQGKCPCPQWHMRECPNCPPPRVREGSGGGVTPSSSSGGGGPPNGPSGGGGSSSGPPPTPGPVVYRYSQKVIEVTKFRELPPKSRHDYVGCVVADIKNRLGLPTQNAANLLVVRRMALNIMENHGVRPTHIRDCIEMVVAGVFIPDEADQVSAEMLASLRTKRLKRQVAKAGPRTWWDRWFGQSSIPVAPPPP